MVEAAQIGSSPLVKNLGNWSREMSFLIRRLIGWMFGPAFRGDGLPLHLVLRCLISQKILLQNRKVPWPVHCTSKVMAPSNIDRGTRYPGLSMGCHIDGRNGIRLSLIHI